MNPVNVTLDLCGILKGALCPLPMYNFTGADSLTLPSSLSVIEKIPAIAFKIPDLEGFAQLTLTEVNTGKMKACVQATLSNGRSAHQPAVEWTIGGITLGALLVALSYSTNSPESIIPFRFVELMYLYQTIASSAFLNLNYPSVYRAFALNFAWAMGLLSASLESSLQNSINHMRHLTGGNLADAIGGSAVGLVNRKLSPYNSPSSNIVVGFNNLATSLAGSHLPAELSARSPNLSDALSYLDIERRRDTIVNGIVQTVTAQSSNVLQGGLPIYVNMLHIVTANAFMTAFICALCIFAITIMVSALGYCFFIMVRCMHARKRPTDELINFDYPSFVISWFLRVVRAFHIYNRYLLTVFIYSLLSCSSPSSSSSSTNGLLKTPGSPSSFPSSRLLSFAPLSSTPHSSLSVLPARSPLSLSMWNPSNLIVMGLSTPNTGQQDITSSFLSLLRSSSAPSSSLSPSLQVKPK